MKHPFGINAGAFGEECRRELLLSVGALIAGHGHERSPLTRNELVAAHAVIFLDHPPAFLNVAAVIQRAVLIAGGKRIFLAAQEKRSERANLFLGEVQIRHAQLFGFGLFLSLIPDLWLGEFVLEKAFLVVTRIAFRG